MSVNAHQPHRFSKANRQSLDQQDVSPELLFNLAKLLGVIVNYFAHMFPIKHLFNPYGTSVDGTHRARCMFPRVMHETGSNAKTPKLLIVQKAILHRWLSGSDASVAMFDYNAVHGSDEMLFTQKLQQDNE